MPSESIRDKLAVSRRPRGLIARTMRALGGISAFLFAQACDDGTTCLESTNPALHIVVVDSVSLKPLALVPTLSVSTSTGFVPEFGRSRSEPMGFLVFGTASIYNFALQADGYQPYAKTGINVVTIKTKCGGILTVTLTAKMQPQ